ncbi:MAG: PIN domain-containing protein [Candidatus Aminicenantes bacterium]|jgi:toxin-antitoxin system PIN domain toxin|nr:PIN domain-containing protein [Candidatus Aminicenantes bacterium]
MIAIDSNLLVYAHREDSTWHAAAYARLSGLAEGRAPWTIPWPCLHEFLAVVTHPRVFAPPTPLEKAVDQVEAWLESPSLILLAESEGYWRVFRTLLGAGHILGPKVHDARIAALCLQNGVSELWTIDRDFSRFPGLKVRNPLV